MKVKYPVIGFAEKIIQADIIQKFLSIFRDTQDIHRILAVIPLVLFLSHSWYMSSRPTWSAIPQRITNEEALWFFLAGLGVLFVFSWAIFSSPFNPSLYVRQSVFAVWTGLLHRLGYGLETLGTTYITVASFVALSSFLPFAFTGLTVPQLFNKIRDDYKTKKEDSAFIEVPSDQAKADAA